MKTRIIYPNLWSADEVIDLSKEGKVLLFNLLTTPSLGLSRYLKHGDHRAMFETGLKIKELKKAQQDILVCDIKYHSGWYYLGCDYAYLDYEGRDRVEDAKSKEISSVPVSVIDYFKGLETGYKPVLNHKPETINHKEGGSRGKHLYKEGEVSDERCQEIANKYDVSFETVKKKREDMMMWSQANSGTKADWAATLMTWIRADIESGKIAKTDHSVRRYAPPVERKELTDEQKKAGLENLKKFNRGDLIKKM